MTAMMKNRPAVEIIPWHPDLADTFRTINEEWITQMFAIEEMDRQILDEPIEHIIRPGGQIWFARAAGLGIVGTCALMVQDSGAVELTKMGVLASSRGLGVGDQLLRHVLDAARAMEPTLLYLLTNHRCEAAIALYLRHGFVHCPDVMRRFAQEYDRCDVAMRWAHLD